MTKQMEEDLLSDVAEIKNALIESQYGIGLIKDHKLTKEGMYANKREITRFKTIVYAISMLFGSLVISIGVAANWIKIFGV